MIASQLSLSLSPKGPKELIEPLDFRDAPWDEQKRGDLFKINSPPTPLSIILEGVEMKREAS